MGSILLGLITDKKVIVPLVIIITILTIVGIFKYQQYVINSYKETTSKQLETINSLKHEVEHSTELVIKLMETNEKLLQGVTQAVERINELEKANNKVVTEISKVKKEVSDTRLRKLTEAKPGIIEGRVNKATKKVFEQLEQDTK